MANLSQERVTTGKPYVTGAIFVGPDNSDGKAALPTSATTTLPQGYNCLGYITSDGVTNGFSVSTTELKAWGGDTLLNPLESYSENYGFTCAELNKNVLEMVWGEGSVKGTDAAGLTIDHSSAGFEAIRAFAILVVYQDGSIGVKVIPKGQLTNLDTIN